MSSSATRRAIVALPASEPSSFFTGSAAGSATALARTVRPCRCCAALLLRAADVALGAAVQGLKPTKVDRAACMVLSLLRLPLQPATALQQASLATTVTMYHRRGAMQVCNCSLGWLPAHHLGLLRGACGMGAPGANQRHFGPPQILTISVIVAATHCQAWLKWHLQASAAQVWYFAAPNLSEIHCHAPP